MISRDVISAGIVCLGVEGGEGAKREAFMLGFFAFVFWRIFEVFLRFPCICVFHLLVRI